jgi:hypothetical protein
LNEYAATKPTGTANGLKVAVSVGDDAVATMLCVCAPPSDQLTNS